MSSYDMNSHYLLGKDFLFLSENKLYKYIVHVLYALLDIQLILAF